MILADVYQAVPLKSVLGRGEVCSKSIKRPERDRAEFYNTRHDPTAVLITPSQESKMARAAFGFLLA